MEKDFDLAAVIKISDEKSIQIGETVLLFEKPVIFVGFLNTMLVFAIKKPRTINDIQISLYTVDDLKSLDKSGALKFFNR